MLRSGYFLVLVFLFGCSIPLYGQADEAQIELWVERGVALHDLGDFAGALGEFDKVLDNNPNHFVAGAEKSMSLFALGKYQPSIALGERLIRNHPDEAGLAQVFAQTGNALDMAGQPEEAIAMYRRGIARFPDAYLLHYNLGIAFLGQGKAQQGLTQLLTSIELNPVHPGSHHALGVTLARQNRRTESILALLRFTVLESATPRSIQATALLTQLLEPGLKPVDEISDQRLMGFAHVDSILQVETEQMERRSFRKSNGLVRANAVEEDVFILGRLLDVLEEGERRGEFKDQFSRTYLPFFIKVASEKQLETLVYMAHSNTGMRYVSDWLSDHFEQVESLVGLVFYEN